jgi:CHAD domain-containing protein
MSRRPLPADLPKRSAEEAVRRLALVELDRAEQARAALVEGDREAALHDFRVALRRLRSLLRSYRGEFALAFPKKELKRIGKLASATNPGRDAEVQLAWLAPLAELLRPAERPGYAELVRQIGDRRDDCYRKVEREIVRDFGALATGLRERLTSYRLEVRLDRARRAATFSSAGRAAAERARKELDERLDRVHSPTDEEEGHAARIAAKRLRYLLEPLAAWYPEAKEPVSRLKAVQDLLGELHDGQLLAALVASSLAEIESRRAVQLVEATLEGDAAAGGSEPKPQAAPSRRRERAGLLAVARALGEHRSQLFERLSRGWLDEERSERRSLAGELDRLDESLAGPPRRAASSRPKRKRGG